MTIFIFIVFFVFSFVGRALDQTYQTIAGPTLPRAAALYKELCLALRSHEPMELQAGSINGDRRIFVHGIYPLDP